MIAEPAMPGEQLREQGLEARAEGVALARRLGAVPQLANDGRGDRRLGDARGDRLLARRPRRSGPGK